MNKIKVSIIIPIYSPDDLLLKRCLDSALNQTLDHIEVLCIDDGSNDETKDILNDYSKIDSRCKVIAQENLGAGSARNNGIEHSEGEYIVFLDADDWIESDMCESLYNHAEGLDVDLVLFDNVWHREDNSATEIIHFNKEEYNQDFINSVFDYKLLKDKIFNGYFGVIWTKFYKSSFLKENNIHFPNHKLYNDIEFHIKSLLLAKNISYCPKVFYHYNKSDHESLQTSYRGKKEAMVFYDVMVGIRDFLIEQNKMKELRMEFLDFAFENFILKLTEMSKEFKQDYFLKIKSFFESMGLCPNDFDDVNFRYLPYYVHMVNSNDFDEFKARLSHFDKELINPERYAILEDNDDLFDNKLNQEYEGSDLEKMKLKCSDKYILILENSLVNEHKLKNNRISDLEGILKNKTLEIEKRDNQISDLKEDLNKSKENERTLEIQNKDLLEENEMLKGTLTYKIKSFLKNK